MNNQRDTKWDMEITREFNAPVELVFKAWSDTSMMNEWLVAEDWKIVAEGDFVVGSRVKQVMSSEAQSWIGYMEPKEIIENEKIVMNAWWEMPDGSEAEITEVTITFQDLGDSKTLLTYYSTFEREDSVGRGEEEYDATLQMFADYIETKAV